MMKMKFIYYFYKTKIFQKISVKYKLIKNFTLSKSFAKSKRPLVVLKPPVYWLFDSKRVSQNCSYRKLTIQA